MEIKSIILAAGKGTRMKSEKSKVLHEILGKPLLGYVLDNVKEITSENIVIVGHKSEQVSDYVKKNYSSSKTVLQSPQLGTGHAVSMACKDLESFSGCVIVLCGDTPLIRKDTLLKFINFHNNSNSDITVMSAIFDEPGSYGRIVRENDNTLKAIVEQKDATDEQRKIKEVNAGIYCLNWQKVKDAFSQLSSNNAQNEYYLTDIIAWGKVGGLNVNAYILEDNTEIYGINSRENLAEASMMMNQRKLKSLMENGVTIVDPASTWISEDTQIGEDTTILPFTYIEGVNLIGKNCNIGPCAHLRGDVVVENNVKVGNFVEVKKSHIKSDTNVGHLAYIGDSELGERVNIGAGTITANYEPISKVKSKTILENDVKIGSNTVLVAPVKVENGANIGAGSVITKDVKSWALALTRAPLRVIENWVNSKK